jgi:hypothetical protein
MKQMRNVPIKRAKGSVVSVAMKLSFDTKTIPQDQQQRIWDGLGVLLAAALMPEERDEFLAQLKAAMTPRPRG